MIFRIALLLLVSLLFASFFKKISQPYLLGYILTGVVLGPILTRSPESKLLIEHLGEFGLLMLIFQIGIEFDLEKFKSLWKKSVALFLIQSILSFSFAKLLAYYFNFDISLVILITCLIVLSSTAVVVRLLDEMNQLHTEDGSFIISILILQDLAIIPITIILTEMKNASLTSVSIKVGGSILGLFFLMQYLSNSSKKFLKPLRLIFDGNQEIVTLASIAISLSFASIAELLGLAPSYGTFLAGLILGSFGNRHDILDVINPIGSMLMMVFFIYVGSLINLSYITANLFMVILLSLGFLSVTMLVNYITLRILNFSKIRSFFISSVISQASEFSFSFIVILFNSRILSDDHKNLLNTLCVISLTLGSIIPLVSRKIIKDLKRLEREKGLELDSLDDDVSTIKKRKVKKDFFPITLFSLIFSRKTHINKVSVENEKDDKLE